MTKLRTAPRRKWANAVVAVASAYAVGAAAWFPPELASGGRNTAVASEIGIYVTYVLAGVLGFGAMLAATRWSRLGQLMVVAAGVVMLLSFLTLHRVSLLAVLSIGGTALAFLAAAPFMGDMPSPREEKREKREKAQRRGD